MGAFVLGIIGLILGLMMTQNQFEEIMEAEDQLIDAYKCQFGEYPLNQFGKSGDRDSDTEKYSAAFYDYWRSTKIIQTLVEEYFDHQIPDLIKYYREWVEKDNTPLLQNFFISRLKLTENKAKEMWF